MMKRAFGFLAIGAIALAGLGLLPAVAQQGLGNIFVHGDTDSFDPGLPIGAQFPAIRALYQGKEITDIDQFMGEKGVVFFANRSVDW